MTIPGLKQSAKRADKPGTRRRTLGVVRHVSIDIETGNASEDVIQAAIRAWTPPSNMTDADKIEKRRQDAADKIRERSALLDGSPIVCVAIATEKGSFVFTSAKRTEADMLAELRIFLDAHTDVDSTIVIGFNLRGFDLPRLRIAYVRNKMKLPRLLAPRLTEDEERKLSHDVMFMFTSWFTAENHREPFISLGEVIARLGIPQHKDIVDGAQVPGLWANEKYTEVERYCEADALATYAAFLIMTNEAPDAK